MLSPTGARKHQQGAKLENTFATAKCSSELYFFTIDFKVKVGADAESITFVRKNPSCATEAGSCRPQDRAPSGELRHPDNPASEAATLHLQWRDQLAPRLREYPGELCQRTILKANKCV